MLTFTIEVDVTIARPPTPANTRTRWITVAVDDAPLASAEVEACLIAAQMAAGHAVMPLATRIIHAEL